jgi:hypothetical protein
MRLICHLSCTPEIDPQPGLQCSITTVTNFLVRETPSALDDAQDATLIDALSQAPHAAFY